MHAVTDVGSLLRAAVVLGTVAFVGSLAGPEALAQGRGGGGGGGAAVAVDPAKLEPFRQTVPVLARLVTRQGGPVAARAAGAIADIKVDVGDRVAAGDVIAVLVADRQRADRDDAAALLEQRRAQLATGAATLAKTKQELQRMESLRQSTAFNKAKFDDMAGDVAIAESRLAEMRAQVRQAEVQLIQAGQDLANTVVTAPYAGVVTARNTEIGAYVGIGNPVVALVNDREIEIEADVPTDRLAGLKQGTEVEIQLDDATTHTAVVRAIVPQENPTTRTRPVRLVPTFGQVAKTLATNQSVKVLIPAGAVENVVTVHKDAVLVRNGATVVYTIKEGRAEERPVVLGPAVRDRLVVKSGLAAEDLVVTRGNEQLRAGQPVRLPQG